MYTGHLLDSLFIAVEQSELNTKATPQPKYDVEDDIELERRLKNVIPVDSAEVA